MSQGRRANTRIQPDMSCFFLTPSLIPRAREQSVVCSTSNGSYSMNHIHRQNLMINESRREGNHIQGFTLPSVGDSIYGRVRDNLLSPVWSRNNTGRSFSVMIHSLLSMVLSLQSLYLYQWRKIKIRPSVKQNYPWKVLEVVPSCSLFLFSSFPPTVFRAWTRKGLAFLSVSYNMAKRCSYPIIAFSTKTVDHSLLSNLL